MQLLPIGNQLESCDMKKFYKSRIDKLVKVADRVNCLRRDMVAKEELLGAVQNFDHAYTRVNTFGQVEIVFTKRVEGMQDGPLSQSTIDILAGQVKDRVCQELRQDIEATNDKIADIMGKVEFARTLDVYGEQGDE